MSQENDASIRSTSGSAPAASKQDVSRSCRRAPLISRIEELVQLLQNPQDPSVELHCLIELCNILLMISEETTLGYDFPRQDVARVLMRFIRTDYNFDIVNHACRALTYLIGASPRVAPLAKEAIPHLLEQLRRVEYIDVAEQALAALKLFSRRHAKRILYTGGINTCLMYIDFLPLASQRSALQVVTNCCLHLTSSDFDYVTDSLSILSQRLNSQDKKSVEIACFAFSGMVEKFLSVSEKLNRICEYGLLSNICQLLIMTPPVLGRSCTFAVIRMLHLLCSHCPALAPRLVRLNITNVICHFVVDSTDQSFNSQVSSRTSQELKEIVLLISELMPVMPVDGMFEVSSPLKPCSVSDYRAVWKWEEECGVWRPYSVENSETTEEAYDAMGNENCISKHAHNFASDLINKVQISETDHDSDSVQQKYSDHNSEAAKVMDDPRSELINAEDHTFEELLTTLFPLVHEIYSSTSGRNIRNQCLRAMLRMLYHCDAKLLNEVTKKVPICSLIAGKIGSGEFISVLLALQLTKVLIEKLPHVFILHFQREGVAHELQNLAVKYKDIGTASSYTATLSARNQENVVTRIKNYVHKLLNYFWDFGVNKPAVFIPGYSILMNLCQISESLKNGETSALRSLVDVLYSDVTCFEIMQSDLVGALYSFLTKFDNDDDKSKRLKEFCKQFYGVEVTMEKDETPTVYLNEAAAGKILIAKLVSCVGQLEQFPVSTPDLTCSPLGSLRGMDALRFLRSQKLKCRLVQHPDDRVMRQWKHGTIKIDPLTPISALEMYMVAKGCTQGQHDGNNDDKDFDATCEEASRQAELPEGQHRIEFLMRDAVLPYDMTVYQAVRRYSAAATTVKLDETTLSEVVPQNIWKSTHSIWYRACLELQKPSCNGKSRDLTGKQPVRDKFDDKRPDGNKSDLEFCEPEDVLTEYLHCELLEDIKDPSVGFLKLLRVLYGLCRFWWTIYQGDAVIPECSFLLPSQVFISAKIASKIHRQMHEPLNVLVDEIPPWVELIGLSCPFLLPFGVRHATFYALALDRDRALQRLSDLFNETGSGAGMERLAPRLKRTKIRLSRNDIIGQAELAFNQTKQSRAVLEIEYENEPGTGSGPTLEFYALVSHYLQRSDLALWHGDVRSTFACSENVNIIHNPTGLYPAVISQNVEQSVLNSIKSLFKMIGLLLARTILDGRILDLPLNALFYKWILKEKSYFSFCDLSLLDPVLYQSMLYIFAQVLRGRDKRLYEDAATNITSLELDFTLPGYPSVELKEGGKHITVSIDNALEYLKLVTHRVLRTGVSHQMDALCQSLDSLIDPKYFKLFYAEELEQLFCGKSDGNEEWEISNIMKAIHPDHGYTHGSLQITWLAKIMNSFDDEQRRQFLQFVTGSPRLPVRGLRNLSPPLTVVRKHIFSDSPDLHLPSVMTCVNYLKIPEYTDYEVMKKRVLTAVSLGRYSFHLS